MPTLYSQIRPRDRVTIVSRRDGKKSTGTAVMKGPGGWVLNMGGKHGRPALASEENVVAVRSGRSRNGSSEFRSGGYRDVVGEDNVKVSVYKGKELIGRWWISPPMYELKLGTWGAESAAKAGFEAAAEKMKARSKRKNPMDMLPALFNYHEGQGSAIYAVASTLNAGRTPPDDLIDEAIDRLEWFRRRKKSAREKSEIRQIIQYLEDVKGGREANRRVGRGKPTSGGRRGNPNRHRVRFWIGPSYVKKIAAKARAAGYDPEVGTEHIYVESEGSDKGAAAHNFLVDMQRTHGTDFGLRARNGKASKASNPSTKRLANRLKRA